ncbi:hypothetical protein [Methylorubrum suomiense]|uniref:Uncharacterized protein n=1 Tax=Methylorubrum suomiense TaxID=144191 RepID=A0ABQ4V3G0_9HYPH|nr:hypothetical protein [Methylorubrum suomiense]GJE78099.1 hypothetical protein BGCPKDLD_4710 [Methylorubrum suomiense]
MYFNMKGFDFLRLQSGGTAAIADPLDPAVLFSGAYEDGQGLFYQQEVNSLGVANSKSYVINFSKTFARTPMVFGTLRLTQPCTQSGRTWFNAGECLAPCSYRRQPFNSVPQTDWGFYWTADTTSLGLVVSGFAGIASFLVLEIA